MYIYIYGYTSSSRSLFITKRVAESWEREKERKQVWNIFASLHTFSLSVYYLQLCTRCTRFIRLYEKVFGTDEGSALGKIFRSRHHVARFPDLENHVQSTRPFGRVLVPQHPITLNSKLILWQLCSFQMRKIIMRIFTKNYRHITNNQFKIFSFFCNLCFTTWIVRFKSEGNRAKFRHDHGILGNRAVEIPREQLPLVVHALQFLQGHAAPEFSGSNHVERVSVQMIHQIVQATCISKREKKILNSIFKEVEVLRACSLDCTCNDKSRCSPRAIRIITCRKIYKWEFLWGNFSERYPKILGNEKREWDL